jgi:hypothetical protein
VQLAAQDEPAAEAGADGQEREVVEPDRDAPPLLADRGEADVVLHRHRHAEPLLQRGADRQPFEPGDVARQPDLAARRLDHARHAGHRAVQRARRQGAGRQQAGAQVGRSVEHDLHVGAGQLDVVAGAHLAAQVADRAAQEAGAEVEPEHERRLRDRLEERRAVLGALGVVVGLAHQPRLEQGRQRHRHRRLGDADAARDLRARDRRAIADRLEHRALVEVAQERRRCGWVHRRSPESAENRCGS